jgi:hypothetical protein
MMRHLAAILFFAAALPGAAQEAISPTDTLGAATSYANEEECLAAAKASKDDPAGLFRAGRYLMAKAYTAQASGGVEKGESFDLCRNAYGFFESAFRLEPGRALYAAWAGSARLLSCAYGSTFDAIRNGTKGVDLFKAAIKLDPKDPDLRLLRSRAYVYLPRAYYPDCDQTILEDSGIAIEGAPGRGALLDEALCYRCIALKQLNRPDEALALSAKIDEHSRFAAMARDWRKR